MHPKIVVDVSHVDPIIAIGLSAALRQQSDFDVEAVGPADLRRLGALHVVVTDYAAGLQLAADLRRRSIELVPPPAVLVVTQKQRVWEVRRALEAGVRGYLLMECGVDELGCAVRSLSAGMRHIGTHAARLLADSIAREALTRREDQVLGLLVEGLGNKAVARSLDISVGTVKSHLRSIYGKLDATSRTEAVTFAERRGLFDYATLPVPHALMAERAIGQSDRASPNNEHFRGLATA